TFSSSVASNAASLGAGGGECSAFTTEGTCCPHREPAQYAPSPMISPMANNRIARPLLPDRCIATSFIQQFRKYRAECCASAYEYAAASGNVSSGGGQFEFFNRPIYLSLGVFNRARTIDLNIGHFALFVQGHLRGDALLHLFLREAALL